MGDEEMKLDPHIQEFIHQLEAYRGGKLNYPVEVGELLGIVIQTRTENDFEELIFQAKFLVKAQDVMKRIGPSAEGYDKLSTEFQSGIKNAVNRLKVIIDKATDESKQKYFNTYFSMETDSYNRLLKLFSDLSWMKNWQVDRRPLPYETRAFSELYTQKNVESQSIKHKVKATLNNPLSRVERSAMLSVILLIFLVIIDRPVTTLGWILLVGIELSLVYIVLQVHMVNRTRNF